MTTSSTNNTVSPRHALLLLVAILGVAFLVGAVLKNAPNQARLDQARNLLKRQQDDFRGKLADANRRDQRRRDFQANLRDFWLTARDGAYNTGLAKAVEAIAAPNNARLTSIGDVRAIQVGEDGPQSLEFTIAATVPLDNLPGFLAGLNAAQPRFFWQRCSLRPDQLRTPQNVLLTGTLRVILLSDEWANQTGEAAR